MKRTQADPDRDNYGPTLPPTEKEVTAGDATQKQTAASAVETADFTEAATAKARDTQADGDRPRTHPEAGHTASFVLTPSQGNTEPMTPGGATVDAPTGRGNTLSFELKSQGDDSMKTLPPGAETPEDKMPRVAGFEILEVLGVGGMGIVYKARQVRLDRFVAPQDDSSRGRRSSPGPRAGSSPRPSRSPRSSTRISSGFSRSASTAACRICSLEYLSGGSLAKKIGGKPVPVDQAASIVETLAGAMATAHRGNIIHRDLKPAERLARRRRHTQDNRLRPGEAAGGRFEPDAQRLDPGHARATCRPNRRVARPTASARPPTSTPWARSSTSS